jgi:ribosome biogenesis protein NSA2
MYTQLGVMTKGTVIEVNVSELGMVTAGGKIVFGKYAQITNNPENDGCINAVLRMCFPLGPSLIFTCLCQLCNLSMLVLMLFNYCCMQLWLLILLV